MNGYVMRENNCGQGKHFMLTPNTLTIPTISWRKIEKFMYKLIFTLLEEVRKKFISTLAKKF